MVTYILLVVGGLNWGLLGAFDFNLVMAVFGGYPMIEKVVYILVGLSAVYSFMMHKSDCMWCMGKKTK